MKVRGKIIDLFTRCEHYKSELDIIAIKFKCCGKYYACYKCHNEEVNHNIQKWKIDEFNAKAVLCGACGNEMTINEYFNSNNKCRFCNSSFNPKCVRHNHLYFQSF